MRKFETSPILGLAVLGGLSGVFGAFVPGPSFGEAPQYGVYMVLTGVWFALVVGFGVWVWGRRVRGAAALASAATWLGWELAVNLALQLDQRWLTPFALSDALEMVISGMAAGVLGALVTWGGAAVAVPALRQGAFALQFAVAGGLFGILLASSSNYDHPTVLLVPWQAAIGSVLGAGLRRCGMAEIHAGRVLPTQS